MFSGTEQLIRQFFTALSVQVRALKLTDSKKAARRLNLIGQTLTSTASSIGVLGVVLVGLLAGLVGTPLAGLFGPSGSWIAPLVAPLLGGTLGWLGATLKVAGTSVRTRHHERIDDYRAHVQTVLRESNRRVVMFVDDVDRLTPEEIREILKTVRLTASFPNLIYVLACDRVQVTDALGEQGSRYLEKIVQYPFNLPEVPRHRLLSQVRLDTAQALGELDCGVPDADTWANVLNHIIMPLISNMRDVRRYGMSIRETIAALGRQISLADVLGLEAIRLFLPQVFDLLPASIDVLTYPPMVPAITDKGHVRQGHGHDPTQGPQITEIEQLKSLLSQEHQRVFESALEHLFPAAQGEGFRYHESQERAFQDRRVSCRSILLLYLERFRGEEVLALNDAERALKCMNDLHAFGTVFREVDAGRWPYIVGHLSGFPKERYRPEQIEPGLIGLWNLLEYETEQFPDERVLRNAVFRATRQLFTAVIGGPTGTDDVVRRVSTRIRSVGARADFVKLVCGNGGGSRIASERLASELVKGLEPTVGNS